jgi:hypothetical protein
MEHSGFPSRSIGTVSGVFFSKKDADAAYNSLLRRGHTPDDISVLMSDETLNKHQNPDETGSTAIAEPESALSRAASAFTGVLISITSMISLPGLGISISNALQKKLYGNTDPSAEPEGSKVMQSSGIPDTHTDAYGGHMKEGGIIISVDPRNKEEKKAIIKDFRDYNGHDILGDDGYTELG